MYFFPLASNTPPFPLLCTLYNSLMTLSGELVRWALCAACEKRLPKITSRGINEKRIVLIVSVPRKFAILRKHMFGRCFESGSVLKAELICLSPKHDRIDRSAECPHAVVTSCLWTIQPINAPVGASNKAVSTCGDVHNNLS